MGSFVVAEQIRLSVFKQALYDALLADLDLKQDPNINSFITLTENEFPWCQIQWDSANASSELSNAGIMIDVGLSIVFAVRSDQENYENDALDMIGRLALWVDRARSRIDLSGQGFCLINSKLLGWEILGFENTYSSGGGKVSTIFTMRIDRNCTF